jgi:hypothetical protein
MRKRFPKYSVVFRCNETVKNQSRARVPLSDPAFPAVSSDYIQFYQGTTDNVPEDERVLPIPEKTPVIVEMFRKASAVSKPPKRIRYDKQLSSCLSNTKKRRRRINGFLGFKLYYARILPPLEPKVKSDLLVNAWGAYEYQWMWEQYTAQYRRYPRSIGFVDWLSHVPKYTVQGAQRPLESQQQDIPGAVQEEEVVVQDVDCTLFSEVPFQNIQNSSGYDSGTQDLYTNISQDGIMSMLDPTRLMLESSPFNDMVDDSAHSSGSSSHLVPDTGYFESSNSPSSTAISDTPRSCDETGCFPFDENLWASDFTLPSCDNGNGFEDLADFDNLILEFMEQSNCSTVQTVPYTSEFSMGASGIGENI